MKRILATLLSFLIIFSSIPLGGITVLAVDNTTNFLGGDGTEENPYKISSKTQLNNVRNYPDAHFILIRDIVFSESDFAQNGLFYNDGRGFEPINAFAGSFDGNGHTIQNLYINATSTRIGLFGSSSGTIKDLGLIDYNFKSSASTIYIGSIVGYMNSGTIENCYNFEDISVANTYSSTSTTSYATIYSGGIVGYMNSGTIDKCYNKGNIVTNISNKHSYSSSSYGSLSSASNAYTGGIAGYIAKGTITNCYNIGNIDAKAALNSSVNPSTSSYNTKLSSNSRAGGIVGYNASGASSNCYNAGKVTSNTSLVYSGSRSSNVSKSNQSCAGGIVGYINSGTNNVCYNVGSVYANSDSLSNVYFGGIAGYSASGTNERCYYADFILKGVGDGTDNAVSCSAEKLKTAETFEGFDYEVVWEINEYENYPFPTLKNVIHNADIKAENITDFAGGTGTIYDPYIVETKEHLDNVREYLDSHFVLANDIQFSSADFNIGGEFYNNGQGFLPLGDKNNPFIGSFDGNGNAIKGILINSNLEYVGLLGFNCGHIHNLTLEDGCIVASRSHSSSSTDTELFACSGGIVGYNSYGKIANCSNTSAISSMTLFNATSYDVDTYSYSAGIAGYSRNGTIINCNNAGEILSDAYATSSNSRASINSVSYSGGIIGFGKNNIINNCHNTGSIDASTSSQTTLTASAIDSVYAYAKSYAGGITGYSSLDKIKDCYNTGTISSPSYAYAVYVYHGSPYSYAGGISGYASEISNCYNTGSITSPVGYDGRAYIGGIAGQAYGSISNSHNKGDVSYTGSPDYGYVGGITGYNSSVIEGCYNSGNITSVYGGYSSSSGGIAGYNSKTVQTSYNTGKISSYENSGGIVGYNVSEVTNCYNIGVVDGAGQYSAFIGGVVGYNTTDAVSCCYNIGDITNSAGMSSSALGGVFGYSGKTTNNNYYINNISKGTGNGTDTTKKYTSTQMQKVSNFVGFSFNDVWIIDGVRGYAYPQLLRCLQTTALEKVELISVPTVETIEGISPSKFGTLRLTYADGYNEEIAINTDMISALDYHEVGIQKSCITYAGVVADKELILVVKEKSISRISVTKKPRTVYTDGQFLDITGGIFTIYYDNGTQESLDLSEATVSYPEKQTGTVSVTVEYCGFSTNFNVVFNEKQIHTVNFLEPSKLTYVLGEDICGGSLHVFYVSNDNYNEIIPLESSMISGYNKNMLGYQTVYVVYEGYSFDFVVFVDKPSAVAPAAPTVADKNDTSVTLTKITGYEYKMDNGSWQSSNVFSGLAASSTHMFYQRVAETETTYASESSQALIVKTNEAPTYIVVFEDWDGKTLSEGIYHYGDEIVAPVNPTRAASNSYTYTFAGWDKTIVACVGDETYTATYTSNYIDYTVVFKNWNGDILSTNTYHYGDIVEEPHTPTKESDLYGTYLFSGWDKAVTNCAGDATYIATYKTEYTDYVVKFQNWNGTIISNKTYHYGDKVTAPSTPTRDADNAYTYTFAGWDKTVVDCAGNTTYTATYTPIFIDYTIVFKNWNGSVLSTKTYHYGDKVAVPADPTKESDNTYTYDFAGWDKSVVDCAGATTYTATYNPIYIDYIIVFNDWNGELISSNTYHYGDVVELPEEPTKEKDGYYIYTFAGWNNAVVPCAGNTEYIATFDAEHYHTYKTSVINPTCTNKGYTKNTCTCGNTYNDKYVSSLGHTYSNNCDKSCNVCGKTRTVGAHKYSNSCDTTCNYCNAKRTIKHTYSNSCDTSCNVCKATRTITHSYKTTTTKATLTKNGSIVKKCAVCGKVASNTAIKYAKTFKLSTTTYTYDGKVKTPSVTVKDSAGKTLKKNTDYTVSYASGRKNVGTYKVTIKMIGKYSGTKALTFKINPTKTTVSKLTAGKKSITVAITKKSTQVTGYQIQYSTSKTFSKAKTKTISSYKTTKYTLKSLSAKKTYYVRVRTYKKVGSTTYYSGWSTYKYVKTK